MSCWRTITASFSGCFRSANVRTPHTVAPICVLLFFIVCYPSDSLCADGVNSDAQKLQPHEAKAIAASPLLQGRVFRAYEVQTHSVIHSSVACFAADVGLLRHAALLDRTTGNCSCCALLRLLLLLSAVVLCCALRCPFFRLPLLILNALRCIDVDIDIGRRGRAQRAVC